MSTFTTKFGIGDIVYYFGDKHISKARIRRIDIVVQATGVRVVYGLGAAECNIEKYEKEIFSSVEELVKTIPINEIRDWRVGF
jgi:hypothetical protein